jgi:hypothetical protein
VAASSISSKIARAGGASVNLRSMRKKSVGKRIA